MRKLIACLMLVVGSLVVVPATQASAATCSPSFAGSIKWGSGSIYGYGTAKNCNTVKYTKVCVTIYYATYASQGPAAGKCSGKLSKLTSVGVRTASQKCVAGYYSVQVVAHTSSGSSSKKTTKWVDTTGGCPKAGSNTAT